MKPFNQINTVDFNNDKTALEIIDQTQLPGKIEILDLTKPEDIWEAIFHLKVRGAPAIGVAAAIGIYVCSLQIDCPSYESFKEEFIKLKDYLASSRPTAVNLFWALNRMEKVVLDNPSLSPDELKGKLLTEAETILNQDIESCKNIGEYGNEFIHDGDGILTHCNAGRLATVKYGTALAPVYIAQEHNKNVHVFTDETRPLLQGARLSAFELSESGIDTTVICDNMASSVMQSGKVQIIFVGADRIAANGDTANKIGTSGVAILAKHYHIPFYVCAPLSTIDTSIPNGSHITIEQRNPDEVTTMWYKERMAPSKVNVLNPAFDVTDHSLIAGIITDYGVALPPFSKTIPELFEKALQQQSHK